MKVAIFGGTFDPIHSAHIQVAAQAVSAFELDRVLFIPAAHPPHKDGTHMASYEDRLRMVELACAGDSRFSASRLEEGAGKSYTIQTVEKLRAQLSPSDRLLFLIGTDAFAEIDTWFRWRELLLIVEFIVVSRPGHHFEIPEGAVVHRLDSLALEVSSSAIRRKLAAGEAVPELPPAVAEYIAAHKLYQSE